MEPVSETVFWLGMGITFVVGFILGKVHEYYLHENHKGRWKRLDQENAMPLAKSRDEMDDFFDTDASWENPWDRVVSDRGLRPME